MSSAVFPRGKRGAKTPPILSETLRWTIPTRALRASINRVNSPRSRSSTTANVESFWAGLIAVGFTACLPYTEISEAGLSYSATCSYRSKALSGRPAECNVPIGERPSEDGPRVSDNQEESVAPEDHQPPLGQAQHRGHELIGPAFPGQLGQEHIDREHYHREPG